MEFIFMERIIKSQIAKLMESVSETSLLPLWARAMESTRTDALFRDEKAIEMLRAIDYDFSRFKKAWMSQLGIAVRTELFDKIVKDYLKQYPDGCIINLGAGFDSRFYRLDNGSIQWHDIDLPEVIKIKRLLLKANGRYHTVARSILDFRWIDEITPSKAPPLIIAEGLLMYFSEEQIKTLMNALVTAFPKATMAIELLPMGAVGNSKWHEAVGWMNTTFKWSIDNIKHLERWNSAIRVNSEWCILDYHWERWGAFSWFSWMPVYRFFLGEKVVLLEFL
jgi:O-methyltransferase involved in polyketide biosynthesis